MNADVASLQSAVNRYAHAGNFPGLVVDGVFGTNTRQGVYSALSWLGQGKCYKTACPDDDTAKAAATLMAQWDESATSARGLAEFLRGNADDLDIPLVAAPVVPAGGGGIVSVPVPIAASSISIFDRFQRWPLWQQFLLSAIVGFGLMWAVNRAKKAAI